MNHDGKHPAVNPHSQSPLPYKTGQFAESLPVHTSCCYSPVNNSQTAHDDDQPKTKGYQLYQPDTDTGTVSNSTGRHPTRLIRIVHHPIPSHPSIRIFQPNQAHQTQAQPQT